MSNQKIHWNNLHQKGDIDHYSDTPTSFALEVAEVIPSESTLLELGCGAGNDSIFFANKGHTVLATDFSDVAISKNKERAKGNTRLLFEVLDLNNPINKPDDSFDVVYARLSLHYFDNKITKQIFKEIHRVLKPDGYLCFICKSTSDPLYGLGNKVEQDMYEHEGHIRHFFSESYVHECLDDYFNIEKLESGKERFYGNESAFVKVISKNKKH